MYGKIWLMELLNSSTLQGKGARNFEYIKAKSAQNKMYYEMKNTGDKRASIIISFRSLLTRDTPFRELWETTGFCEAEIKSITSRKPRSFIFCSSSRHLSSSCELKARKKGRWRKCNYTKPHHSFFL